MRSKECGEVIEEYGEVRRRDARHTSLGRNCHNCSCRSRPGSIDRLACAVRRPEVRAKQRGIREARPKGERRDGRRSDTW